MVTQPDRPANRGMKITPPAVKVAAEELGLPVYQPERIRDPEAVERLRALAPDLAGQAHQVALAPLFQAAAEVAARAVAGIGRHRPMRQPLGAHAIQQLQRDRALGPEGPLDPARGMHYPGT